jgi:ABC-type glycerol-3-phosphate transport system substrate-binding protein
MKKFLIVIMLSFLSFALFASARQQTTGTTAGRTPLNISFWWNQQEFPENDGDAFGKFIEDKFNVDIKITVQDWGDYEQRFKLWAASNDLPDTFSGYPTGQSWFTDFINEGLIRSIPSNYISRFPLLKKNFDSIDMVTQMRNFYGDNYYLPRPEAEPGFKVSPSGGIFYRKDWALKAGITERPQDVEAFYNMLEAFVTRDPDGNGRNDTYGYSTSDFSLIYNAYGAFPGRWLNGPNNRIIPGWADEVPMIEALTWLRRAWSNNLLDKEMPGASNDRAAKFGQGVFGAVYGAVQPTGVIQYVTQQFGNAADPLSMVDWIGGFASRRGGVPLKDFQSETSGAVFRHNLSDDLLLKYMEIWEYLLGDEAKDLTTWGFRDVDYRVEANGSKTSLLTANIRAKYPSVLLRLWATWAAEVDFTEGPAQEKPIRDFASAYQVEANRAASNAIALRKINELGGMLVSSERSYFDFGVDAALLEIISGTGDITTMYRAMIDDANRRGLQRVIDAQTALMRR